MKILIILHMHVYIPYTYVKIYNIHLNRPIIYERVNEIIDQEAVGQSD